MKCGDCDRTLDLVVSMTNEVRAALQAGARRRFNRRKAKAWNQRVDAAIAYRAALNAGFIDNQRRLW